MSKLPILYTFRRCPYAMRARLAIAASGKKVELREVVFREKPEHMLEQSPKGTVPVVIDTDGKVYEESRDVMDWVLAGNDNEGWLKPDVGTVEEMQILVDEADGPFKDALDRFKYPDHYENNDPMVAREKASTFLRRLDARLAKYEFLFGSHMTYADAAILPFVRQFANVDREWFDSEDWPHVKRWLEAFLGSERLDFIMDKYPQWHEGDAVTVFPQ